MSELLIRLGVWSTLSDEEGKGRESEGTTRVKINELKIRLSQNNFWQARQNRPELAQAF